MIAFVLALSLAALLDADNWPQFRGPGAQGHAVRATPPTEWSEKSNVAWKTAIPGLGWSSPVIWGDRIWVTTATGDGQSLRAVCVHRGNGKIVYDVEVFAPATPVHINAKNSHASPTPVLEPGRVYLHFGAMGTACLDAETGKPIWKNEDIKVDHMEGPGSSPLLVGDNLVFHCDGVDEQFIVAVAKANGTIAWKTKRSGKLRGRVDFHKAYCTPLAIERGGKTVLVSPAADHLYTYDAKTGKELGRLEFNGFSNVPRPVESGGIIAFATGYMKPELWGVRIANDGSIEPKDVVWKCKEQVPANPSPIVVDDLLYMVSDRGIVTCLEMATGKLVWRERMSGATTASPIAVAGRLYFFADNGMGYVVRPGRKFLLETRNELSGRIQASPAALEKALFVRTDKHLYRLEETNPQIPNNR